MSKILGDQLNGQIDSQIDVPNIDIDSSNSWESSSKKDKYVEQIKSDISVKLKKITNAIKKPEKYKGPPIEGIDNSGGKNKIEDINDFLIEEDDDFKIKIAKKLPPTSIEDDDIEIWDNEGNVYYGDELDPSLGIKDIKAIKDIKLEINDLTLDDFVKDEKTINPESPVFTIEELENLVENENNNNLVNSDEVNMIEPLPNNDLTLDDFAKDEETINSDNPVFTIDELEELENIKDLDNLTNEAKSKLTFNLDNLEELDKLHKLDPKIAKNEGLKPSAKSIQLDDFTQKMIKGKKLSQAELIDEAINFNTPDTSLLMMRATPETLKIIAQNREIIKQKQLDKFRKNKLFILWAGASLLGVSLGVISQQNSQLADNSLTDNDKVTYYKIPKLTDNNLGNKPITANYDAMIDQAIAKINNIPENKDNNTDITSITKQIKKSIAEKLPVLQNNEIVNHEIMESNGYIKINAPENLYKNANEVGKHSKITALASLGEIFTIINEPVITKVSSKSGKVFHYQKVSNQHNEEFFICINDGKNVSVHQTKQADSTNSVDPIKQFESGEPTNQISKSLNSEMSVKSVDNNSWVSPNSLNASHPNIKQIDINKTTMNWLAYAQTITVNAVNVSVDQSIINDYCHRLADYSHKLSQNLSDSFQLNKLSQFPFRDDYTKMQWQQIVRIIKSSLPTYVRANLDHANLVQIVDLVMHHPDTIRIMDSN